MDHGKNCRIGRIIAKRMKEIDNYQQFFEHQFDLKDAVIRGIDFHKVEINWTLYDVRDACFLECSFEPEDIPFLIQSGAFLFSAPADLPYQPFRKTLYRWDELTDIDQSGYTRDLQIYHHFSKSRFNAGIHEALFQRMHDHAIDSALAQLLNRDNNGSSELKCIAIMGGHSVMRNSPYYKKVALLSQKLAQHGYFVCSGGGPGIMEAANLGAYLGKWEEDAIHDSIEMMSKAPHFTSEGFTEYAVQVLKKYPSGTKNLAIPTWFYGHEPSNIFASYIAKYFSNSLREDTLLAIALHGIIFAPGSAGTTQEIFMDAAQNHYGTFNFFSPMIFLGKKHYESDTMIYPILKKLAWGKEYADLMFASDEIDEIVQFILAHPPIQK